MKDLKFTIQDLTLNYSITGLGSVHRDHFIGTIWIPTPTRELGAGIGSSSKSNYSVGLVILTTVITTGLSLYPAL
ncbi:MAG: hypothetical protein C4291_04780 [Candidatus Dadabacteria bacterium]